MQVITPWFCVGVHRSLSFPMPYSILIDEAGTSGSPHEPVGVVVAVMIPHAMTRHAYAAVRAIHDTAPPHFRKDFVFHATALLDSNSPYRDRWPLKDRLAMIHLMMKVPALLRFPVVWSAVRSTYPVTIDPKFPIAEPQLRHVIAFLNCIGLVNRYLTEKDDTAVMVVEQSQTMTMRLNYAAYRLRETPYTLPIAERFHAVDGQVTELAERPVEFRADHISEPPSFLSKDFPLLQLADACAFGIRSYLADTKYGESYIRQIDPTAPIETFWSSVRQRNLGVGMMECPGDVDPVVLEALRKVPV